MSNSRFLLLPAMIGATAMAGWAQPNRIVTRIDNSRTVVLPGRVHPLAIAANDKGAVDDSFPLSLTLQLKISPAQQSALDRLTQQQQNPQSTNFHQWLTPEQYAGQFGTSPGDTGQVAAWLVHEGFTVEEVARSRTFIFFHGSAGQVKNAFGASIHRYRVNGELHYANASDPTIPAALSGVVAGIRGLNDFRVRPRVRKTAPQLTTGLGVHYLVPDDFATIYDIMPMYSNGINGSGQSIAIVGESALYNSGSDITAFWNLYGLTSAKLVQKLVNSRQNPGVVPDAVEEATLDIEWSSAVARGATIVYVYSDDDWTSAEYAVDQDFAPVLSMSFGWCEMFDLVDLPGYRQMVQQANSEGITWLAAAGDAGAAGCDPFGVPDILAEGGLAVEVPASIPEVTSVGGTMFNEGSGSYWKITNTATGESAKGYIPEVVWNETSLDYGLSAGGGGISIYFPQPAWQTTGGVPNDGWRHVPDLAFPAAPGHDGYYFYFEGTTWIVGGTSAAAPTMAGVVALLNQSVLANGIQSQAGLGNINPNLYSLAQTAPNAFHDITSGNNNVLCAPGSPECSNGSEGFSAGPGYDSASGLGSVDVANLIGAWRSQVAAGSLVVPSIDQNPVFAVTSGDSASLWPFKITLTEEAGIGATLTGFSVVADGVTTSYAPQIIASLFGSTAIAPRGSITASWALSLTTVPQNVTFGFSGTDATGAAWSAALTEAFVGPQTAVTAAGIANAASYGQAFAPGELIAVFGTGLGAAAQAAATIPLPQYIGCSPLRAGVSRI